MSAFQVLNSNRFYLPGAEGEVLHLASIAKGLREFVCFYQRRGHNLYLEEITGGQLRKIEEESLWNDLYIFLAHKGFLKEPFILEGPYGKKRKISISVPKKRF